MGGPMTDLLQREDLSTGIDGLDDVLNGGLTPSRSYLLEGHPGTGKTTIALHFLRSGAAIGERCLYVTLAETEEELRASAASHAWSLDGVDIFELVPPEHLLDQNQQQSFLYSADVELGETTKRIFEACAVSRPQRVVLDSLSEIRLLAQGSLRYRRQVLALKHYFAQQGATVLMLDDLTVEAGERTAHSIAHGVFLLQELAPEYGAERRRLRVAKYRGHRYRGGYHDFVIRTGGVAVFPRLVSAEHSRAFARELLSTGNDAFNALLGGGIDRGSSQLVLGPAGAGKSLLALTFIANAAKRGERSAMFVFDEEIGSLIERAKGLGIDLQELRASGRLTLAQVDAAELSPGEFSARVRSAIEVSGARTIVIDSLNGYQSAMPHEQALILHIHELLQFCNRHGATTFLTVAHHGLIGEMRSPVDLTYLADTVILLRYFEVAGHIRRAMSIVKKRTGAHEATIREYTIDGRGITVGPPLTHLHGVMRGVPTAMQSTGNGTPPS